jgi:hypothetical protein
MCEIVVSIDRPGAGLKPGMAAQVRLVCIPAKAVVQQVPQLQRDSLKSHVSLRRFDQPGRFFIYPCRLEAPLPEIAIPLLPGDGAVSLDLQAVFTRCYDTGPYRRHVVYDPARLVPPLAAERAAWVKQLVSV